MGKAGKWFRSLFGAKKSSTSAANSPPNGSSSRPTKNLTDSGGVDGGSRRNYGKRGSSAHHQPNPSYIDGESLDANKHAIAVAAATAAVAEAALAAAHAAAEVVRLTTGGSGGGVSVNRTAYLSGERRRELAAVKIQSAFRAYLAQRALRALKGLVKLQALVRGHIVRKQSADMLRRMQAMARVQARACANRACLSVSSHSSSRSSHSQYPRSGIASNAKGSFAQERHQLASNWLDHWMEETSWSSHRDTYAKYGRADDEKSDKILEIDTWKPHLNQKPSVRVAAQNSHPVSACNHNEHRNFSSSIPQKPSPTGFAREALPLGSMIFQEASNQAVWTAENSPRVCSSSSRPGSGHRRSPFTPARSEYARSLYGDYPSYPNYMANTESSRAKLRSHSAPRQRMQFEKPGLTRRLWEWDSNSERGLNSPG